MSTQEIAFTIDNVEWRAWLDPVDVESATPEQIAVLEASHSRAKTMPYYLLLAHDVEALRQRSLLFNAVMYGPKGLPRADRELATLAVSRVNGCVYCAAVHSQRYVQLSKQRDIALRILEEGVETDLPPRERAIVDYAVKLTLKPTQLTVADLEPLRAVGLSDLELLDLNHAIAMFAWANRLMQTLGEPVLNPAE